MPNLSNPSDPINQQSGVVNTNAPISSTVLTSPVSHNVTKEQEPIGGNDTLIEEVGQEMQVSSELEKIGVQKRSDTVDIPADVARMGVIPVGQTQQVVTSTVTVPLTDDQIIKGLHAQIISSLRWLAEWCVKQLKKAHIHLKKLSGKVVREREM